jgi:hypothetical protein
VSNPHDVKENYDHALQFALRLSRRAWALLMRFGLRYPISARGPFALFARSPPNLALFLAKLHQAR